MRFGTKQRLAPGREPVNAAPGTCRSHRAARYDRNMTERRAADRRPIEILFNKYVDGHPQLCRVTDLSAEGLLAVRLGGPEHEPEAFAIELRLPGDAQVIWAWAHAVWRRGRKEAVRFVAIERQDARRIQRFLRIHPAPAS